MLSFPLSQLDLSGKVRFYNLINKDYLNINAIFSDETQNYVSPCEPAATDNVTIRIRTGKNNVDRVFLHTPWEQIPLTKRNTEGLFDYYAATLPPLKNRLEYYFILEKNNKTYYYNKRGLFTDVDKSYHFKIIPGFQTPEWAKGAVMYQIYVDRFHNGDSSNNVVTDEYTYLSNPATFIEEWNTPVTSPDICNFYGGDLKGVMDKMSYLKELGVEVIYFNPLFVSPSNHKYDIQDYDYVDPHYGVIVEDGGEPLKFEKYNNRYATMYIQRTTNKVNLEASNQLLVELIQLAHDNGIKVLLDGVFNHCGAFNKWMDREGFYSSQGYPPGAYREKDSPYHDYFKWYDANWPFNDCYDSWWGHDNHPKLNFEASPELYQYILDVGKKWVSAPFHADGWRLDVAADLGYTPEFNHKFWRDFRKSVKEGNPDAIIIAEHYGDPVSWLEGDQWDSIMNYDAFMEPLTWFLTGMEKHSEYYKNEMFCNAMAFEGTMRYNMSKFSIQSLLTSMNQLSNHDHSRFLTRTNQQAGRLHTRGYKTADQDINKNIFMEAIVFQMTWPGCPTLYYGDEAGLCGWTDPDNRRPYPWGKEDQTILSLYKKAIAVHKANPALINGSTEFLYSNYGILSYGRWTNDQKIAVVLNNNSMKQEVKIPVWKTGIANGKAKLILQTGGDVFMAGGYEYPIQHGYIDFALPPYSSMVLLLEPTV